MIENWRCGTCDYFDGKENERGLCRRYAPQVVTILIEEKTLFPVVHAVTDWCGEYEHRGHANDKG